MIDKVGHVVDMEKLIVGILMYREFVSLNLQSVGDLEKGFIESVKVDYVSDEDLYSYYVELLIQCKNQCKLSFFVNDVNSFIRHINKYLENPLTVTFNE